ncbi:korC, partial [Klebsiella pneumoniae]
EWVHVQLHQQKGMISLSPPTICNSADERTIRKWKTGQTRMVFTTWCCLCWVAGLGMPLDNIISG